MARFICALVESINSLDTAGTRWASNWQLRSLSPSIESSHCPGAHVPSLASIHHYHVRAEPSKEEAVGECEAQVMSHLHSQYGAVLRSPPQPMYPQQTPRSSSTPFLQTPSQGRTGLPILLFCPPLSTSTGTTHHPGREIVLYDSHPPPLPRYPRPFSSRPLSPVPPASRTFESHAYPAQIPASSLHPPVTGQPPGTTIMITMTGKKGDWSSPIPIRGRTWPGSVPISLRWSCSESSQIR